MAVNYLNDIGGGVSTYGRAQLDSNTSSIGGSGGASGAGGSKAGGYAAAALKITAALSKAYAAYSQQEKIEYTSKYNKALVDAERQVSDIGYRLETARIRKSGERFLSTQRSLLSKNGLEMSGSSIDVMQESVKEFEMDLFSLKFNQMVTNSQYQSQIDQLNISQVGGKGNKVPSAINAFIGGFS